MKFKKLIAALSAAAMAVTSFSAVSLTAYAEGEVLLAGTSGVAAKSVEIVYSLSTEKQYDWEYSWNAAVVVVKTWCNSAGAGDWIQTGFGGVNQAQYNPHFIAYEGVAHENESYVVNLTEYPQLDALEILWKEDTVMELTIHSVKAYSEADGKGDVVWSYPEEEKPDPTPDGIKDTNFDGKSFAGKDFVVSSVTGIEGVAYIYELTSDTLPEGVSTLRGAEINAKVTLEGVDLTKVAELQAVYSVEEHTFHVGSDVAMSDNEITVKLEIPAGREVIEYGFFLLSKDSLGDDIKVTFDYCVITLPEELPDPTPDPEPAKSVVVFEGEKAMASDWSTNEMIPAEKFAGLKSGAKLICTVKDAADGAQYGLRYPTDVEWVKINDYDSVTGDTFVYELTDEDVANIVKYGLVVTGHDYALTKVEFVNAGGEEADPEPKPEPAPVAKPVFGTGVLPATVCTITYVDCDKSEVIANGGSVTFVPTKEGYTFAGWYLDPDCKYPFSGTVDSTRKLYPKWAVSGDDISLGAGLDMADEVLF